MEADASSYESGPMKSVLTKNAKYSLLTDCYFNIQ